LTAASRASDYEKGKTTNGREKRKKGKRKELRKGKRNYKAYRAICFL